MHCEVPSDVPSQVPSEFSSEQRKLSYLFSSIANYFALPITQHKLIGVVHDSQKDKSITYLQGMSESSSYEIIKFIWEIWISLSRDFIRNWTNICLTY
jgi:hypothetical protein